MNESSKQGKWKEYNNAKIKMQISKCKGKNIETKLRAKSSGIDE